MTCLQPTLHTDFLTAPRHTRTPCDTCCCLCLGDLAVPDARDLDLLWLLGAQVSVGRLDRLEHARDLAGVLVHACDRPYARACIGQLGVKSCLARLQKMVRSAHCAML